MSGEGGDWNSVNSAYYKADKLQQNRPSFYIYNAKNQNVIHYTPYKKKNYKGRAIKYGDFLKWRK